MLLCMVKRQQSNSSTPNFKKMKIRLETIAIIIAIALAASACAPENDSPMNATAAAWESQADSNPQADDLALLGTGDLRNQSPSSLEDVAEQMQAMQDLVLVQGHWQHHSAQFKADMSWQLNGSGTAWSGQEYIMPSGEAGILRTMSFQIENDQLVLNITDLYSQAMLKLFLFQANNGLVMFHAEDPNAQQFPNLIQFKEKQNGNLEIHSIGKKPDGSGAQIKLEYFEVQ